MKRVELIDLWRMDATPQQLNAYSHSDLTIFQTGEDIFRVRVLGDTLGEYDAQGVLSLLDELAVEYHTDNDSDADDLPPIWEGL